jgi:hypothetical protein
MLTLPGLTELAHTARNRSSSGDPSRKHLANQNLKASAALASDAVGKFLALAGSILHHPSLLKEWACSVIHFPSEVRGMDASAVAAECGSRPTRYGPQAKRQFRK